ncbi:uncharacterized protein aknad1 [Scleropages formosus]|uniref:uncharacterized protein aknad1 n=1 Tax=Scleropages formosus TaxID=113540 RepID=UPI000878C328|nr:uncharacterized protein LOC108934988 [Scleropages formosus]
MDTDSHASGQPIAHRGGGHLVMALGDDRKPVNKATAEAHPHTCTCHNEAISALQSEVARLKKDLEKSLQYLPYITKRMDCLASKCKVKKRCRRKVVENCSSEDWITSGSTEDPDLSPSQHDVLASPREKDTTSHRGYPYCDERGRSLAKKHVFAAHSSIHLKGKKLPLTQSMCLSTKSVNQLHQKDWRSSWSLPAGITAIEDHQRRSLQSDFAMLPRNQLFQKTQCPPHTASKARSHRRSREKKNEEVSRTLDMAIEAAWSMKQTTERMARNLSVDLAKVELYQKLHGLDPHSSGTNDSC